MIVHINGSNHPADSATARAFRPGTPGFPGVYTTLRVVRGVAPDLAPHLQRLRRQAAELEIPPPAGDPDLPTIIRQLCAVNGLLESSGRLRITLAARRPAGDLVVAVEAMPPHLERDRREGVAVITLAPAFARTHLPHLKTLDMAASQAALAEARRQGAAEALVHDAQGHLLEGAISNLFLRREERWLTPPDDGRILAGLTRRRILERVPGACEAALTRQDLMAAPEVFVCNSLRGIVPVVRIDGLVVGDGRPGPATTAARRCLTA